MIVCTAPRVEWSGTARAGLALLGSQDSKDNTTKPHACGILFMTLQDGSSYVTTRGQLGPI